MVFWRQRNFVSILLIFFMLYFLTTSVLFVYLILLHDGKNCSQSCCTKDSNVDEKPTIYVITPTYSRLVQKAELTRLMHTFMHVPDLQWIVVEDSHSKTKLVENLLEHSKMPFVHLCIPTPESFKLHQNESRWRKPRGVLQRNKGLEWLRNNLHHSKHKGVVYFADDDNTYDLTIFSEMRYTKKVSVWPVGLVGHLRYESPLVDDGVVVGWFTYWKPQRPFAMDMAGFAINLDLLLRNQNVKFSINSRRGELESDFLKQLVTLQELEPKAGNCTEVLVWHTQSISPSLKNEDKLRDLGMPRSDPRIEI